MNIDHLSKLSRLTLTEDEKKKFSEQLGAVLNYFKVLDRVDTSQVEPLIQVGNFETFYRMDEVKEGVSTSDLMKNAPHHDKNSFIVSKVADEL